MKERDEGGKRGIFIVCYSHFELNTFKIFLATSMFNDRCEYI